MLAAVAWVITELALQLGGGRAIERGWYDAWHRLAGQRTTPQHVVLVTVDDQTLLQFKDDPLVFWTPYFAQAMATARAAGAAVIGFDFLFAVSPEGWIRKMEGGGEEIARSFDIPFREEIASGKVVLAAARVSDSARGEDQFLLPHRDYLLAVPDFDLVRHVGLANLETDSDGVVRSFSMRPAVRLPAGFAPEEVPRLSLAALLAVRAAGQDPAAGEWLLGGKRIPGDSSSRPIVFSGPPGTLARLPMARLLAPDALRDPAVIALAGKVVMIGVDFLGMGDSQLTPYARGTLAEPGRLMSGAELQANVVETLLSGRELVPLAASWRTLLFATCLLASAWTFRRLPVAWGLPALLAGGAAAAAAAYAAFLSGVVVPLAHLHFGLVLAYVGAIAMNWSHAERERKRVQQMFGRYVSDAVVEALLKSHAVPQLGGEAMRISVLFSDIRGFTTTAEKLQPQEVVGLLNDYFEQVCAAVLEAGGTIDKFVGDAIMVEFGAPYPYPDHARRALRTALRIAALAEDYRPKVAARFAGRDLPEFRVGIGVHSGDAVVGNIGSIRRSEFTAIGDTVNIASRIEGATKEMGCTVLASRATVEMAGAGVVTGRRAEIALKGKRHPVEVIEILGLTETGG
jgi:adenylate cyclase